MSKSTAEGRRWREERIAEAARVQREIEEKQRRRAAAAGKRRDETRRVRGQGPETRAMDSMRC